ncbi:MAG: hypothetical protein AABX28_01845 [Nanoarchaeota archaeon]
MSHKQITQKEAFGCSVACVASLLGISYNKSLKLFGKYMKTGGAYCSEVGVVK